MDNTFQNGETPKVCILSFSSRPQGNCAQIGAYLQALHGPAAVLYRFSDCSISPCGGCDYDCFGPQHNCPHKDDRELSLLEAVSECDLAYFIVPNYCDYPCANYFIFCERGQSHFSGNHRLLSAYEAVPKKFIVISNTARDIFEQVFSTQTGGKPDILFLAAKDFGLRSIQGNLLSSLQVQEAIKAFAGRQLLRPGPLDAKV